MVKSLLLDKALCLPAPDIEALIQGQMIVAMPRTFIDLGWQFTLYPSSVKLLPTEQYYRPNFLSIAQTALSQLGAEMVTIKAWARCELCQILDSTESLNSISQLTVWTTEALQEKLRHQQYIFLAYLYVYQLTQPLEIPVILNNHEKVGKFVGLPDFLNVNGSVPVLSKDLFVKRLYQLEHRLPPPYPEMEELQAAIAQLNNPAAKQLNHDVKQLLGWTCDQPTKQFDADFAWISTINALGNASTGGNYEKGTAFERIVHKSLAFLGFNLDSNARGGAGGMDLYCTTPYPLVGECKAGQTIPGNTVYELDKLGTVHLGKATFETAVKLIIGPGKPTRQLQKSAKEFGISIINPMSLQKLVELQAKYPGSVNLIELKQHLEPGQVDYRIDEYVQKVQGEIRLRSHLIQLVRKHLESTGDENVGVDALHGAYVFFNPPQPLKRLEMHDILIELSSPLTGYLGREKGSDWQSDRFYFLRDLPVD